MKILVAEDEFVSRKILHKMLAPFGDCDFASDGTEAVQAVKDAIKSGEPYGLICLDINMPELSGFEVLKSVRQFEQQNGIGGLDGVKIVMTTGNDDTRSILGAFKAGCEAYIVKPLDRQKVLAQLNTLGIKRR